MADIIEDLTKAISGWWKDLTIGTAPKINTDYLVVGKIGKGLKSKITRRVNKILIANSEANHKFGKSGQAPFRADRDDYRVNPYSTMFLLYESYSEKDVSEMEVYYIRLYKHLKRNDNISEAIGHPMRSYDGLFHLYLVI